MGWEPEGQAHLMEGKTEVLAGQGDIQKKTQHNPGAWPGTRTPGLGSGLWG